MGTARLGGHRSRFLRPIASYGRVGRELMRNLNRPWSDDERDPSDTIA
jgi:hypothetical protein